MWLSSYWVCLLLLAFSLAPMLRVKACSCRQEHPQNRFCRAEFVAVVKVRKIAIADENYTAYKVKLNRVFKSNPFADEALKSNLLWTASMDSLCGVTLSPNTTYVVSGSVHSGKPTLNLCGIATPWMHVTPSQRKGYRSRYHLGCVCEIRFTSWWHKGEYLKSAAGKRCLWESTPGPQNCQEEYGVCMLRHGTCSWLPTMAYTKCIEEYIKGNVNSKEHESRSPRLHTSDRADGPSSNFDPKLHSRID